MAAVFHRVLYRLKARTLKQRIRYWVGLAVIVMSFCMALSLYLIETDNTEERVHADLQQIVSLQGEYIDAWMHERIVDMHTLVSLDAAKRLYFPAMFKAMSAVRDDSGDYAAIVFFDKNGIAQINVPAQTQSALNVSDRAYFQAAKAGKDYVSGVLYSKVTGKPIITISAPVRADDGEFLGVVAGIVQLETFNAAVQNMKFGKTGVMYIVDSNNNLISKSGGAVDSSNHQTVTTDIVRLAKEGIETSAPYMNGEGKRVYGAYRWSKDKSWLIIGEVDKSEMMQDLYIILYTLLGIAILTLGLSLIGIMVLMKRVERPLRYLLKGTEIIQNGEYGFQIERAYFRKAPVELQLLCEAYNDMSSKLRANVQLLQQTSLIDQLTEAYNRRFIMHEGSRLLESSLAAGKICSVVMADIDFFKSINDTYGHVVGDRVLRYFSDKLKLTNGLAGEVIVARYGGEEFLMLLIGFDVSAARKVAEWSRTMLEGSPYRDGELTVAITASFGISSYKGMREFGTTILEDLIARADHALYEAKRLGRNRTVVYGGNLETDAEQQQREIR